MLFRLQLADPNDPTKRYVITGRGEDQDVYVQVKLSS
jgi:hypothetical protein